MELDLPTPVSHPPSVESGSSFWPPKLLLRWWFNHLSYLGGYWWADIWCLIQGKEGGTQVLTGLAPSSQTVASNKEALGATNQKRLHLLCDSLAHNLVTVQQKLSFCDIPACHIQVQCNIDYRDLLPPHQNYSKAACDSGSCLTWISYFGQHDKDRVASLFVTFSKVAKSSIKHCNCCW